MDRQEENNVPIPSCIIGVEVILANVGRNTCFIDLNLPTELLYKNTCTNYNKNSLHQSYSSQKISHRVNNCCLTPNVQFFSAISW